MTQQKDIDVQVQKATRTNDTPKLISLALKYNVIAERLNLQDPDKEEEFCAIKDKVAEIYNTVANQMKLSNAKLLAALYHIQAKNFERAFKIAKFLRKKSKRGAKDKFLDKDLVIIIELLALKDPDQALKELRALVTVPDPQVKEIILDTANLVKSWRKAEQD